MQKESILQNIDSVFETHKFEYIGTWWHPKFPNIKIGGSFAFDTFSGGELTLLNVPNDFEELINRNFDIINGITYDGVQLTLIDCHFRTGSKVNNYKTIKLQVSWFIPKTNFASKENIVFDHVLVRFLYQDKWINNNSFQAELVNKKVKKIRVRKKNENQIYKDRSWKIDLVSSLELSSEPLIKKEYILKDFSFFKFTSGEGLAVNRYFDVIARLQSFCAICINQPIYTIELIGVRSNSEYPIPIHISSFGLESLPQYHAIPFLFTYSDIKRSTQRILQNFFGRYDLLKPMIELYLGTTYNKSDQYGTQIFLSLIQGIESLHRRTSVKTLVSPMKYKESILPELKATLSHAIKNEDLQKKLIDKLNHLYELSLKDRLRDVIAQLPLENTFHQNYSEKDFINKVVVTRNYLTHFDKSIKQEKTVLGDHMMILNYTNILKLIFTLLLLKQFGFSRSLLNKISNSASRKFF